MKRFLGMSSALILCAALAVRCGKHDPVPKGLADGGGSGDGTFCATPPEYVENVSSCQPAATDYQPRVNASAGDSWPACLSDDNTYHRIQESISTIARVAAFEEIAAKLWNNGKLPVAQDFVDAKTIYAQDQGLDSRVQRREDIHYGAPAGSATCQQAGIPAQYPDRCVGPAKLLPISSLHSSKR